MLQKTCIFAVAFQMPMRNRAEMRHEALLSRQIMTQESNVVITDFIGGSYIFTTYTYPII